MIALIDYNMGNLFSVTQAFKYCGETPRIVTDAAELMKFDFENREAQSWAIIDKIVDGKINKFYSEVCLVNQPWIRDDKTSFAKLKPNARVKRFVRWEVGEEL